MDEEAGKVDLRISFRHAFNPKQLLTAVAQIKSGPSYRRRTSDTRKITLQLDRETVTAMHGLAGIILWVPPSPSERIYWYASDPRRPLSLSPRIPHSQFVRPSIRYDLTRLLEHRNWTNALPRQTVSNMDDGAVIGSAKKAYSKLKSTAVVNPLVGRLNITRLAWRHVTRRSKVARERTLNLRATPHLPAFLTQHPTRFTVDQASIDRFGSHSRDRRYILCWYRNALVIDNKSYSLAVRIREEISYPTQWLQTPLSVNRIVQIATLESWWCKLELT